MKSYDFTITQEGHVTSYRRRNVSLSSNSPHGIGPHGKRVLLFRQNALSYVDTENHGSLFYLTNIRDPSWYYIGSSCEHDSGFYPLTQLIDSGDAPYEATRRFYRTAADFGANIGDLYRTRKETINMVTSNVEKLARAAGYLARRQGRAAMRELGVPNSLPSSGSIPRKWLELQYGWLPVLADIHSILDKPFPEVYRVVKSRATHRDNDLHQVSYQFKNPYLRRSVDAKVLVRGRVSVNNSTVAAASHYGLTNPAVVGWEALPYSFVLDWLLPVGPYLEMLTAIDGLSITDTSITTHIKCTREYSGTTNENSSEWNNYSFSGRSDYKSVSRSLDIGSVPLPRLKNPVSLGHFSNAMSLLAVNLRKLGH